MKNSKDNLTEKPFLIICMGVSGCGKSTLAEHLAARFNLIFLEADEFHSEENKTHMASGKPLTDAMREPWIKTMCEQIKQHKSNKQNCCLAYSGLRKSQRQQFRELGMPTLFLHLAGQKEVIIERMKIRENHFMPASLLDSQYEALESTSEEKDIIEVDISQNIHQIILASEKLVTDFNSKWQGQNLQNSLL